MHAAADEVATHVHCPAAVQLLTGFQRTSAHVQVRMAEAAAACRGAGLSPAGPRCKWRARRRISVRVWERPPPLTLRWAINVCGVEGGQTRLCM